MNTFKRTFYSAIAVTGFLSQQSLAQINVGEEKVIEGVKGIPGQNPIDTIQMFVKGLLSFLGIIMVGMALWGGWKILTSGSGDEGKEAGKKIIINAIIGIVIIFFAWTISSFVFDVLTSDTIAG